MAIAGTVVHPLSGLSPIVGELVAQKISQLSAYRAAQLAAPLVSRRTRQGTYVKDNTFRGLDLSKAPNVGTAASVYSTEYPSQGVAYSTDTYDIARYTVDQQDIPDAVLTEWLEVAGVSVESRVADLMSERVAAMHAYKTWSTLGDTSTGFDGADPGNITSSTFDLIGLLQTVRTTLIKAQAWQPGAPLNIFGADDIQASLQKLDQVRARIVSGVSATNTYATPDVLNSFFADYLPGARYVPVTSYYKASDGTVTADLSGKLLFLPERGGWDNASFTIVPDGPSGVSIASIRSERIEAMPGTRLYGDAHMQVKIANASGGYLAHGLLS